MCQSRRNVTVGQPTRMTCLTTPEMISTMAMPYDMPYDIMVVAAESDDMDTSYTFSVCLIIIYDCCMCY